VTTPIGAPGFGRGGQSILAPGAFEGGRPVGGPASTFNIGGAPIAVLGGVFSAGLPIGSIIATINRSTLVAPNTVFFSSLTPGGPIGELFLGASGLALQFGPSALYFEPPLPRAIGPFGGLGGGGAAIGGGLGGGAPIGI
jgi:hypothetical protein